MYHSIHPVKVDAASGAITMERYYFRGALDMKIHPSAVIAWSIAALLGSPGAEHLGSSDDGRIRRAGLRSRVLV